MGTVIAMWFVASLGVQAAAPSPQELLTLAAALGRGSLSAREDALGEILKLPPERWSPEVWTR